MNICSIRVYLCYCLSFCVNYSGHLDILNVFCCFFFSMNSFVFRSLWLIHLRSILLCLLIQDYFARLPLWGTGVFFLWNGLGSRLLGRLFGKFCIFGCFSCFSSCIRLYNDLWCAVTFVFVVNTSDQVMDFALFSIFGLHKLEDLILIFVIGNQISKYDVNPRNRKNDDEDAFSWTVALFLGASSFE